MNERQDFYSCTAHAYNGQQVLWKIQLGMSISKRTDSHMKQTKDAGELCTIRENIFMSCM